MRSTMFLGCLLLTLVASLEAQPDDPDAYSIDVVRNALANRSRTQRIINSWSQKQLSRLGDGVAIALIKILDERDFTDAATVHEFLLVIKDSFAEPRFIVVEEDRKPKVTLFLLGYLRRSVADVQIQEAVEETTLYVKQKVASLAAK